MSDFDKTRLYTDIADRDDLIEQLQQRNVELEQKSLSTLRDLGESHAKWYGYQQKCNQLTATVERLREALHVACEHNRKGLSVTSLLLHMRDVTLLATPQQNLNAVKREVSVESYIEGFNQGRIKRPIVDLRNPIDLAKKHANTRYPSGKGGE